MWRTFIAATASLLAASSVVEMVRAPARGARLSNAPEARVARLKLAVQADAASPYRWCELAEAFLDAGDAKAARRAIERAWECGPHVPAVWVRSGNLYFRTGDLDEAVHQYARALALAPDFDAIVFSTLDRMAPDPQAVLRELEPDRRSLEAWFLHLLDTTRSAAAEAAWHDLDRMHYTSDRLAARYTAYLLKRRLHGEALAVWRRYTAPWPHGYANGNLLFNGGFEAEPSGAPMDWHLESKEGVEEIRDNRAARPGAWCLRIRFPGDRNLDYRGAWQNVVARPGPCQLRVREKTEGITSGQGPRIHIYDAEDPSMLENATEDFKGTHGWTERTHAFLCPARTRLLRVEVQRQPSTKFDNKVAGTLWLDDMVLLCGY